jgi:hypothetical protein
MNDLFFNGAKRLVKGAKNLDGVLICIKIGYITHLRSIGLIQKVSDLFLCRKGDFSLSAKIVLPYRGSN